MWTSSSTRRCSPSTSTSRNERISTSSSGPNATRSPSSITRRRASSQAGRISSSIGCSFSSTWTDTQVGIKVFRREVVERVLPLLLVKQFAFDLELLVVAHRLGYGKIKELPVRLDHRFTGSDVRSMAVRRALIDTAAVFYRLRILRTYQRKAELLPDIPTATRWTPPVSVLGGHVGAIERLDYPRLEEAGSLSRASSPVLAVLAPGALPAGNWVSAAVPFLSRDQVAAVVSPVMAPGHGPALVLAAAAVLESRFGGGSRRIRSFPGNVRVVRDYPAESVVIGAPTIRPRSPTTSATSSSSPG